MLDKLIIDLLSIKSSLTIASGEMGIIPFYIANTYFGKVEFIDLFGLTTDHLTKCNLKQYFKGKFGSHLFRGRLGIQIGHWFLLHNFTEIQKNCPLPYLDIIYGRGTANWMETIDKSNKKT